MVYVLVAVKQLCENVGCHFDGSLSICFNKKKKFGLVVRYAFAIDSVLETHEIQPTVIFI